MRPSQHVATSGIFSILFAYVSQSVWGAIVCFISGILIDLDHVIDFWIAKKRPPLRYVELFEFCAFEREGKLYLCFHAYEWLVILWTVIVSAQLGYVYSGLAFGMTTHLLMDQIFNPLRPGVYFLGYRLKYKFSKEYIFPEGYFESARQLYKPQI